MLIASLLARPCLAELGQLDASPSLFTALAALNAAGYDAELNSPANHPLRQMVRQHIASRNIPVLPELKKFIGLHRQKNDTQELSQYISFGLSVTGPPTFEYLTRTVDRPPDILPLDGLGELLAQFHREADIDDLWAKAQPAIDAQIARYHQGVTDAVFNVNVYLRNDTRGFLGRRFQIFLDLLGAPNQIQTRSYGADYFVVLTPSPEPQIDDVRHGYLHYLLDPLSTKYSDNVMKKKSLVDYAMGAPALADHYKEDYLLLVTECLIKALESRLSKKPAMVDQALAEGFILTPYFYEQLPAFLKQEQSMRMYYPEFIDAIDLKKEIGRLEQVKFAAATQVRKAKVTAIVEAPRQPELTGAAKDLDEAERLYLARDLKRAREAYLKILQGAGERPDHARAYYGLARIAILQKDPALSEKLFQKVLEYQPDPQTKAWSLVYLGRLSDASGEGEQAKTFFKEALTVRGASEGARKAAEKAIEASIKR